MGFRQTYGYTRHQKAMMFGIFLLTILVTAMITALTAVGPIVLGSELNTNGLVEYLCIGRGCENL